MTIEAANHVIVIGAGIMGRDIAAIFLAQGCTVDCILRDPSKEEETRSLIAKSVSQMEAIYLPALLTMRFRPEDANWDAADLVIESVPENLAVKRSTFAEIQKWVRPGTPIGSNASGIPISKITEGLPLSTHSLGLHFFLPAHLVPLVEVVRGADSDIAVAERAYQIMKLAGRVPVLVNRDTPGFLANRIQHAMMREVFAVLDEGLATPEDVDASVRYGFGMRYVAAGPLVQKEFAGLDTQLAAAESIYPGLSSNSEPGPTLRALVAAGHHGTKKLKGFWNWTQAEVDEAQADYQSVLLDTLDLLRKKNKAGSPPKTIGDAR